MIVKENDSEAHYNLGLWCWEHRLGTESENEFHKTIKINPDHKGARKELEFVKKGGKWVKVYEARDYITGAKKIKMKVEAAAEKRYAKKKGYVRLKKWISDPEFWAKSLKRIDEAVGLYVKEGIPVTAQIQAEFKSSFKWAYATGGSHKININASKFIGLRKDGAWGFLCHELFHNFQGHFPRKPGFKKDTTKPKGETRWITEGMASYVSRDRFPLVWLRGAKIKDIDEKLKDYKHSYGRGVLFFTFLEKNYSSRCVKLMIRSMYEEGLVYWKAAERATRRRWEDLKKEELKWSRDYFSKYSGGRRRRR